MIEDIANDQLLRAGRALQMVGPPVGQLRIDGDGKTAIRRHLQVADRQIALRRLIRADQRAFEGKRT